MWQPQQRGGWEDAVRRDRGSESIVADAAGGGERSTSSAVRDSPALRRPTRLAPGLAGFEERLQLRPVKGTVTLWSAWLFDNTSTANESPCFSSIWGLVRAGTETKKVYD